MLNEIKGGFRILVGDVLQAAHESRELLHERDPDKSRVLYHRASYINTQVALLQKQTMELFLGKTEGYKEGLYLLGISSIASRLERMTDILLNLDRQAGYLSDLGFLKRYRLDDFFSEILHGMAKITPALERREVSLAILLGQVEERLDGLYADRFRKITAALSSSGAGSKGELVTSLMIVHYLERLGDMLLEIGEKIIYVIIGEKIKLEQYKAMGAGLRATGRRNMLGKMGFRSIWGGRSGCRIGVLGDSEAPTGAGPGSETVLFKHGPDFKLTRERDNLKLWGQLRPGLTPQVKAFLPAVAGREATLILEYVPSRNLQTLFMENAPEEAFQGLERVMQVMAGVWWETRKDGQVLAEFVRQAQTRLVGAGCLYPQLIGKKGAIGPMPIESLASLLQALLPTEPSVPAPCGMRIHGDFNLSNILYDPDSGRVHVLDLYRSRESDYVQDVSVMLVSILRLPVFNPDTRRRLNAAADQAYVFAEDFARNLGDDTYKARLAFGLARSFLSSTRFVLEERLAVKFIERTRYILEKLLCHARSGKPLGSFALDKGVLSIDPN
ncbi:MAG: phosphotransferase [Deltaproteobacteria bacterium]|jgi:phosphate uptake regulator|nr:phosphotransferase [Deltaproteobacteria bacterium]